MADIDSLKAEYKSNLVQCMQRVKLELDNKASADDLTTLQEQVDTIKANLATLAETTGMLDNILGQEGD